MFMTNYICMIFKALSVCMCVCVCVWSCCYCCICFLFFFVLLLFVLFCFSKYRRRLFIFRELENVTSWGFLMLLQMNSEYFQQRYCILQNMKHKNFHTKLECSQCQMHTGIQCIHHSVIHVRAYNQQIRQLKKKEYLIASYRLLIVS